MTLEPDAVTLFSNRADSYVRFIRAVGYPQGIRTYFDRSPLLRPGLRVLDAGCGTGTVILALRDALARRSLTPGAMHAFDLTPAMLHRLRIGLAARDAEDVELQEASALDLGGLPPSWSNYDLVVSASMLEYIPRARFIGVLRGLGSLLKKEGRIVLFVSRRNWLMKLLIGRWWCSNLYTATELRQSLEEAGFGYITFRRFPPLFRYLGVWGHIVEAASEAGPPKERRRLALS